MKITSEGELRKPIPAWQITIADSGGNYGGPINLEALAALFAAGSLPDSFLRTFGGGKGRAFDLGTLGATPVVDLQNANAFTGVIDQDCTITTIGWTDERDCQIRLELTVDYGAGGLMVDVDGATWIGSPPAPTTAGEVLHIVVFSLDAGVTIWAVVLGGGSAGDPATTVEDETTFGITPAVGTDAEYARQDHTHGTPADPVTGDAVRDAGRWEVLMSSGITDPPEPVWNTEGDDWVYGWVPA